MAESILDVVLAKMPDCETMEEADRQVSNLIWGSCVSDYGFKKFRGRWCSVHDLCSQCWVRPAEGNEVEK